MFYVAASELSNAHSTNTLIRKLLKPKATRTVQEAYTKKPRGGRVVVQHAGVPDVVYIKSQKREDNAKLSRGHTTITGTSPQAQQTAVSSAPEFSNMRA